MENWLPIVGYEGSYEVSSLGRVRSVDRDVVYPNGRVDRRIGQIKAQRQRKDGYLQVNVSKDSKKRVLLVHHVVCEAFHGPRPVGMDVAHGNGVRSDNRADNLRYDTRKGNLADALAHGTRTMGERHGQSKVSDDTIRKIRSLGSAARDRSAEFGLHRNSISRILRGERRLAA